MLPSGDKYPPNRYERRQGDSFPKVDSIAMTAENVKQVDEQAPANRLMGVHMDVINPYRVNAKNYSRR